MGGLRPDWSGLHKKRSFGPVTVPLAACSFFYAAAGRMRAWAYNRRLLNRRSLPGVVVSVGNLTAGGTGKTPATMMLAKWAAAKGYKAAVLTRGYGGHYRSRVLEVSDGFHVQTDPRESGDEPYLLAKRLPGVPLILGKKRYEAGIFAHQKHGTDFFILDDGFQHIALHRDLDIVLLDAEAPFGNGHFLPWGPLRESVSHLSRADAFILTRADSGPQGASHVLEKRFPETPLFYADHVPSEIVFPHFDTTREPGFIRDETVVAFAGIARPAAFMDTLLGLGARVLRFKAFNDHHVYTKKEIEQLIGLRQKVGARYLVTTEKDWVKAARLNLMVPQMTYLTIAFRLLCGYDRFFGMIEECIKKKRNHYEGREEQKYGC